jgi:hypothetical protein
MLIQAGGAALATMVGSGCARSAPSGGASAGRLLHRVRPSDPAWPRAAAWVFLVHHGVGSERWSPDGFTRLA